jgi:hypothetical protein
LFHFIKWKIFTKITTPQTKEKNNIKYSTNSDIAVFKESLNKSKTAAGE